MSNSLRTVVLLMLLAFSQVALGGKARQTVSNRLIQEYDTDKHFYESDININNQIVFFPDEFVIQENSLGHTYRVFDNDKINGAVSLDYRTFGVIQPSNGEATHSDSYPYTVTYKPNLGFNGWDYFQYSVCETAVKRDDADICYSGTVAVFVIANRIAPTAVTDYASLDDENPNSVIVDVLDNDYDADGPFANWESLQIVWPYAEHGRATVTEDYKIEYVRTDPNFVGIDTIYYKICDIFPWEDLESACSYASVSITVNACSTCESCGELSDIFRDHLQSIHDVFRSDVLHHVSA